MQIKGFDIDTFDVGENVQEEPTSNDNEIKEIFENKDIFKGENLIHDELEPEKQGVPSNNTND